MTAPVRRAAAGLVVALAIGAAACVPGPAVPAQYQSPVGTLTAPTTN